MPSPDQGRAAIADQVVRRRRHRRTVQAVTAVLVVVALVAAGLGLTRRNQQSDRVVTGVHQQVPPLPQLGLPASLGQTSVSFLWPGNGAIELVSHLPQFSDELSVVLSDQSLDQLRQQRSGPGALGGLGHGRRRPGLHGGADSTPTELVPDPTGVYWKPDAHHVAALAPRGQTVAQAVVLAGHLVQLSDAAWWAITGGAPSGYATRPATPAGSPSPARHGHRLDDPAARLGLPGRPDDGHGAGSGRQQVVAPSTSPASPRARSPSPPTSTYPFTAPLAKAGAKNARPGAGHHRAGARTSGPSRVPHDPLSTR